MAGNVGTGRLTRAKQYDINSGLAPGVDLDTLIQVELSPI
jgi:hypothetical protein